MATDTNVIVTQYRAEFRGEPCQGYAQWRITGAWQHRETLTRRRRETVARDYTRDSSCKTERAQREPNTSVGHINANALMDADAVIVFVPDSPSARFGTAVLIEQVKRNV